MEDILVKLENINKRFPLNKKSLNGEKKFLSFWI